MSGLSTHILDTSIGRPAGGVAVSLDYSLDGADWSPVSCETTNPDGRIASMLPPGGTLQAGYYRLTFETAAYFARRAVEGFYPRVHVVFQIVSPAEHYHVPLLINPFGYSTYRGS